MNSNDKIVYIFTDGACKGNPGDGGWGAILKYENSIKEIKGFSIETTNNIMELTAVIEALKLLTRKCKIVLTTDSKYVKSGITEWIFNWKKNGWKTANKKTVKNQLLWTELDKLKQTHQISWEWIKGHAGHPENERADAHANEAIVEAKKQSSGFVSLNTI